MPQRRPAPSKDVPRAAGRTGQVSSAAPSRPRTVEAWASAVAQVVKAIPKGQVLSYSQVALRAGMPGNPRGVVRALKLAKNIPWWRVIRADGTVAPELAEAQLPRLRAEGLVPRGRRVVARSASARKPAGARRH